MPRWRMWSKTRITRREFRRLAGKHRSTELAFIKQVELWHDGWRTVNGLEDLRENAYEFGEAIRMLVRGDR